MSIGTAHKRVVADCITTARWSQLCPPEWGRYQYTGEDKEVWWEDWLPMFERAASWNKWTDGKRVIQLVGQIRKRALDLMEWNLIEETDIITTLQRASQCRLEWTQVQI